MITNLWEDEMEEGVFPELYYKRWPLGPKYNQVKQKMELENFSGRLADNIKQDFYAMMTVPGMPAGGLREANENIILRMYERGAAKGMTEQYILEMRSVNKSFFGTRLRPGARVCYMMGPIGVSPQIFRKQGIEESLFKDTAMNIQVLEEQTANWRRDTSMSLAEDWLTKYNNDIDAIICQNDDMAMGALEAAEAKGVKDKVIIVGVDAIADALKAIDAGRLDATVFQDAAGQGAGGVDAAIKLLESGQKKMPDVWIPFKAVTRDNVAQFM